MGDLGASAKDKWVCPNDRQLALRAKLKSGWSVKTANLNTYGYKPQKLEDKEQDAILEVIKRAESIKLSEQRRVGRLVDKLDNMKKNVMGNGINQCILCGDDFGILKSTSLICSDCSKAVCTKCGVDSFNAEREPLWLCKICAETREMLKKSGAWFFKGLPEYILPEKKKKQSNYNALATQTEAKNSKPGQAHRGRDFNTWSKAVKSRPDSSDQETDTSSDEDIGIKGARYKRKGDSMDSTDSQTSLTRNTAVNHNPSGRSDTHSRSSSVYQESVSAADATCGDSHLDVSDSEKSVTSEVFNSESPARVSLSRASGDRTPSISTSIASSLRGDDEEDSDYSLNRRESQANSSIRGPRSHCNGGEHRVYQSHTSLRDSPVNDDVFEEKYSPDDIVYPAIGSFGNLEFSLLYDAKNSTLHCTLHRAKGLRPMDANGLSDPYVKLHLLPGASKSNKLRSKTVHKTLNPEFNETLTYFGISVDDMARRTLRLSVLDEDAFGHDFIGETRVPLKKLRSNQGQNFKVSLDKQLPLERDDDLLASETDRGKLLLSLKYVVQDEVFVVGIIRCANLASMDSNGLSDPFVKVQMKPDPLRRKYKTTVQWKNLNPEFNETFVFNIPLHELPKKTFYITVWDKDYGLTNDYIGGLQIGINSKGERLRHFLHTFKNPDMRHDRWHHLSDEVLSD